MNSLKQMIPGTLRQLKRTALVKYRQPSWRDRALPDFLILGAQKSGTSSLYYYLSQHPQLLPAYTKEVHFFDGGLNLQADNFQNGEAWYRAHFPLRKDISPSQKTFEATPLYIFHPLVPRRIANLIPEVKLIVLLRDPVERAISHYFHSKRYGWESLPIMEALEAEEERLKPAIAGENYRDEAFLHHSYKCRGLYYEQIKRYLHYFPMDHILIINSEKFYAEPDRVLRRVFEFVEVDSGFTVNDLSPRNVANNKSKVVSDIYEHLNRYFQPHNQLLYTLVGENYGW